MNILSLKRKVGTILFAKFPRNILSEMFYPNNSHLLRRYFIGASTHVNLHINIHTGNDEEDPRPPGSSCQQPAQSEDDGPLVLLDHLHHEEEGEREGEDDEDEGEDSHGHSAQSRALLAP